MVLLIPIDCTQLKLSACKMPNATQTLKQLDDWAKYENPKSSHKQLLPARESDCQSSSQQWCRNFIFIKYFCIQYICEHCICHLFFQMHIEGDFFIFFVFNVEFSWSTFEKHIVFFILNIKYFADFIVRIFKYLSLKILIFLLLISY